MTLTKQQALDMGWNAFDSGVGSTPYDPNIESQWRLLFSDPIEWELAWINAGGQALQDYLAGLAFYMGEQAAAAVSLDGHIHSEQLLQAFAKVRQKARADNPGVGSKLCVSA